MSQNNSDDNSDNLIAQACIDYLAQEFVYSHSFADRQLTFFMPKFIKTIFQVEITIK